MSEVRGAGKNGDRQRSFRAKGGRCRPEGFCARKFEACHHICRIDHFRHRLLKVEELELDGHFIAGFLGGVSRNDPVVLHGPFEVLAADVIVDTSAVAIEILGGFAGGNEVLSGHG